MPSKRKPTDKTRQQLSVPTNAGPVQLVVRRGAVKRFEKLKEKTRDMNVVVAWDRREGERRQTTTPAADDRRQGDRRGRPPFTWEVADFAVVVGGKK